MTEHSFASDVSCDPIDVYLDAVERAMTAAHAPRTDRLQVLQDLEAQIADMLAQQEQPLTDEAVCAVIAGLEPPSHFAENYGAPSFTREAESTQTAPTPPTGPPTRNRWAVAAAVSCALIPVGCVLLLLAANAHLHGPVVGAISILMLAGGVITPLALRKAFQQLRAEPTRYLGRELALPTLAVYCTAVPALLFVLACVATEGYLLFPIGLAAFGYLQYIQVRRYWQYTADTLPPQPTATNNSHEERPTPPVNFSATMSMPAL
jgi:hypothetical protein